MDDDKPSIIGRERAIIDNVTRQVERAVRKSHNFTPTVETRRGSSFMLEILNNDDTPTGHYVKVTVELDRFDPPPNPRENRTQPT